MSKTLRNVLVGLAVIVAAAALVLTGMYVGRAWWRPAGYGPASMMSWYNSQNQDLESYRFGAGGMGSGMMGQFGPGYGMMGQSGPAYGMMGSGMMGQAGPGYGMMSPGMMGQFGPGYGMMGSGMMGQVGYGMMGQAGPGYGMMGASTYNPLLGIEPLSISEVELAVQEYLTAIGEDDLELGEIMIFDNHGYAQIVEGSSGIGAMELLIDPVTGAVTPEFGPNMMWNLKYGHMAGSGMMGMMGFGSPSNLGGMGSMMERSQTAELTAEMPISDVEAVEIAQRYLAAYLPGAQADDHADPFYGYHTLHITRDGSTVGMLSVNGYSGQVFIHTWHGDFIEMSDSH